MIALIYKGLVDILARLSAARAAALDNLDAAISTRLGSNDSRLNYLNATIGSRLSGTDARLNTLSLLSGGVVKSVQRGATTITGATTNQTISAVDLNKAVLLFSWPSDGITHSAQLTLTNRITFYRYSGSASPSVEWQVIEFQ